MHQIFLSLLYLFQSIFLSSISDRHMMCYVLSLPCSCIVCLRFYFVLCILPLLSSLTSDTKLNVVSPDRSNPGPPQAQKTTSHSFCHWNANIYRNTARRQCQTSFHHMKVMVGPGHDCVVFTAPHRVAACLGILKFSRSHARQEAN